MKKENQIFSPVLPANTMLTPEDEMNDPWSLPSPAEGPGGEKLQYESSQLQLHFSLMLLLSCRAETETFIQEIKYSTESHSSPEKVKVKVSEGGEQCRKGVIL